MPSECWKNQNLCLFFFLAYKILGISGGLLQNFHAIRVDAANIGNVFSEVAIELTIGIGPTIILLMALAVAGKLVVSGLVFSSDSLTPKMERISPIKGVTRLISIKSLINLLEVKTNKKLIKPLVGENKLDVKNTLSNSSQINKFLKIRKFTNLDKADPQPTKDSLEWDGSVETYADLTYVNTKDLSGNVNYLVKADETAAGFWSIYQWDAVAGIWNRTKIQTYKTNDFWTYFDWYDTGVNKDTYINKQVQYQYDLDDVELDIGQYAKVVKSDTGGWKIYEKTSKT